MSLIVLQPFTSSVSPPTVSTATKFRWLTEGAANSDRLCTPELINEHIDVLFEGAQTVSNQEWLHCYTP